MAVRKALMNMAEYTGGLLGTGPATKLDEFSEKFQGGGAPFSILKFILQILETGLFEHEIDTKH